MSEATNPKWIGHDSMLTARHEEGFQGLAAPGVYSAQLEELLQAKYSEHTWHYIVWSPEPTSGELPPLNPVDMEPEQHSVIRAEAMDLRQATAFVKLEAPEEFDWLRGCIRYRYLYLTQIPHSREDMLKPLNHERQEFRDINRHAVNDMIMDATTEFGEEWVRDTLRVI